MFGERRPFLTGSLPSINWHLKKANAEAQRRTAGLRSSFRKQPLGRGLSSPDRDLDASGANELIPTTRSEHAAPVVSPAAEIGWTRRIPLASAQYSRILVPHARPRPCPPGSPSTQAMRSARTPLVDCGGLGLYSGEKPVDIGRSLHSPAFVQGGVNQQSGKLEAKDVKMHEVPLQEDGIWTPLPGLWPHDACPH